MINEIDNSINTSKVSTSKATFRPILWVSSIVEASDLILDFSVIEYCEVSAAEIPTGVHYIYVDQRTSEATIKNILWRLQQSDRNIIEVYASQYDLLSNLNHESNTTNEVKKQITDFCISSNAWLESRNDVNLKVREAYRIAEVAISLLPDDQKDVELATLRERSKSNSFDWNKKMESLESKFRKEIEKRTGRPRGELLKKAQDLVNAKGAEEKIVIREELYKLNPRLSKQDIQDLIDECLYGDLSFISDALPKTRTAKEFRESNVESTNYRIHGLLANEGVVMLHAEEGVGKTTAGVDLAASILLGDDYLGKFKVNTTGRVLFCNSLAENLDSQKRSAFITRGIFNSDDWKEISGWTIKHLAFLEKEIIDFKPQLLIIDSLFGVTAGVKEYDINSHNAGLIITYLQHLSEKHKVSIVLIHHNNKNQDANGANRSSGSRTIGAFVSAKWELKKDKNSEARHLIIHKTRGGIKGTFKLSYDEDTGRAFIIDGYHKDQETKDTEDLILNFWSKDSNQEYTLTQFTENIERNRDTIRKALKELEYEGIVSIEPNPKDRRNNLYRLKKKNIVPPPTLSVSTSSNFTESIDIHSVQIPDVIEDVEKNIISANSENSGHIEDVVECPVIETSEVLDTQAIQDNSGRAEVDMGGGALKNIFTDKSKSQIRPGNQCKYVGRDEDTVPTHYWDSIFTITHVRSYQVSVELRTRYGLESFDIYTDDIEIIE